MPCRYPHKMLKFALVVVATVFIHADPVFTGSVADTCPPGVLQEGTKFLKVLGNKCYKFYVYPDAEKQYWDAQSQCEKNSGNLAMPKTEEINDLFVAALLKYNIKAEVFIGLDDMNKEGVFRWKDGSKLMTQNFYENFAPGTGIFRKGGTTNRDCVTLNPETNTWQDMDCRRGWWRKLTGYKKDRYFICEYEGQDVDTADSDDVPADNIDDGKGADDVASSVVDGDNKSDSKNDSADDNDASTSDDNEDDGADTSSDDKDDGADTSSDDEDDGTSSDAEDDGNSSDDVDEDDISSTVTDSDEDDGNSSDDVDGDDNASTTTDGDEDDGTSSDSVDGDEDDGNSSDDADGGGADAAATDSS